MKYRATGMCDRVAYVLQVAVTTPYESFRPISLDAGESVGPGSTKNR